MKFIHRIFAAAVVLALMIVSVGVFVRPANAAEPYVCLPTCSTTDGRMLSLASTGYVTLAGGKISIRVSAPGSIPSFNLAFFDGDSSGMWDIGTTPLVFTLYADPNDVGDTSIQVAQWTGSQMSDNAWTDFTVPQDLRAQAPSGAYFYHLHVDLPNWQTVRTWSNFKIRSSAPIEMSSNEAFSYSVYVSNINDAKIIFPSGFPTADNPNVPTTFDGSWDMYVNVASSSPFFSIWDGDTDHGSYDCSVNDTDDPDTPNDFLLAWAISETTNLEGVATTTRSCVNSTGEIITGPEGQTYATSNPPDDALSIFFRRSPTIMYVITDPNGNVYSNDNPSGNQEWEQFRIDSDSGTPADYHVNGLLPAGIYHVHVTGLDMSNLNAWYLPSIVTSVCVYEDGTPCIPILAPYLVGDAVWLDANGDGVQNNGEAGIPGVTVTLLDLNGQPLPGGTAVTDDNGQYTFNVNAGSYSVQVDSTNFDPGGALAGYASTTPGGELQTNTVTNDNVLTYDFGYQQLASLGDKVWNDLNGNGIQDDGETGLAGVTIQLLGSDGVTVLGTQTTAADGSYSFNNLVAGTYFVQFTAPSGYNFTAQNVAGSTTANDSNANLSTGKTDAINLAAGINDTTIDTGLYQPASLGDKVWNDLNGNGLQDSGEAGLPGVTVKLLGSDGVTVITTQTTGTDGSYNFTNLKPGTYSVQFVAPAGYKFTPQSAAGSTAETDSNADPVAGKTAPITLAPGGVETTIDAGFYQPASIGDKVWNDLNGNGLQDSGEAGLPGVTVKLLGSDGTTVLGTQTSAADGSYSFTNLVPGAYYVQFSALSGYLFTVKNAAGSTITNDSNADVSTGMTGAITLAGGASDLTVDAGLKLAQVVNYCGYIRTPGFWKNYANHMSSATFLSLIQHTQDFSYLTVSQAVKILGTNNGKTKLGIPALDGVDARFLKFLLTSEINAVWNGEDNAAALSGLMGTGIYQGTGLTVNQLLHQAYEHRRTFSSTEDAWVLYLGAGGEGINASSCRVQP